MFSNWLLFNLAEASLTQKQFAKLVNVNQETVSRWITGRHYPQAITERAFVRYSLSSYHTKPMTN